MPEKDIAYYIDTGYWSKKAFETAKKFQEDGLIDLVVDSDGLDLVNSLVGLRKINPKEFDSRAAFVHITTNETIGGVQYQEFPDVGVPLVVDMSSELFTRDFDVSDNALIYACGQKNFGFAGFSVVIADKDLLGDVLPGTLDVENYKLLLENDSALNTPPTVAVYTAGLMAEWIKEPGGVEAMETLAETRSGMVYDVIDRGFYTNPVHPNFRSKLNIPFMLPNKDLEDRFKEEAAKEGLLTLGGHRSIGGLRASMYVGMPIEGTEALAGFMENFTNKYG